MRLFCIASLGVIVLSLLCNAQDSAASVHKQHPALPNCDAARVRYRPVNSTPLDSQLASRIEVHNTDETIERRKLEQSPQNTRWFSLTEPDYSKPGPYTTTLYIGTLNDDPTLKMVIRQHEGISIRWLNEKLLYGSVAWGRIVSTDFIFDVEAKKFIYEEMENFGELMVPCN
jgi:hypothetical protein